MSKIKHLGEFRFHDSGPEKPTDHAEGWLVIDDIPHQRPAATIILKKVPVIPRAEWTSNLPISEHFAGNIFGMLGDPLHRQGPYLDRQHHSRTRSK